MPKQPKTHKNVIVEYKKHRKGSNTFNDADRPSAAKRGYGRRWQAARKTYLMSNQLCVKCKENNKYIPATVVDHITPHKGDQSLFWDQDNWQALCKQCHDKKTLTEDVRMSKNKPIDEIGDDIVI